MSTCNGGFNVFQGEDRPVNFSPATPTDITGWTVETRIVDTTGVESVVTIDHDDHVITEATGEVVVTLTRAITFALSRKRYAVELWRINSGHYGRLGRVYIDVRH